MVKGLYAAYTGMINEQNRMDVLTNNLANAATTGYKKEGATSQAFNDVLAYKIKDTSEYVNLAKRIGTMNLGVKIGENYTDYSQGAFRVTENTFDLAISGSGFFTVEFTNKAGVTSTKYTRDGSFTLTREGYLVTKDGDYVLSNTGNRIRLDPTQEADRPTAQWPRDQTPAWHWAFYSRSQASRRPCSRIPLPKRLYRVPHALHGVSGQLFPCRSRKDSC